MGEIEKYLLNLIIKEKKLLLGGSITGLLLFLVYFFFFYTPLYTTTSNLYVKNIIKPSIVASFPDASSILRSESGYSNPLFNLYELIKSENLAFNVYKKVKEKYPDDLGKIGVINKESFFEAYLSLVVSEVIPSTDILSITLKWPDRENAREVLKIVIDEFRQENLKISRLIDSQKRIYLEQQTDVISKELDKLKEKIKDYKIKHGLNDAESEAASLAAIRIDLIKEISTLKAQINYNQKKFEEISRQLNIEEPAIALKAAGIGNDPYLRTLSQNLALARQNLATLRTRFTDKYYQIVEAKTKIEKLNADIEKRKEEVTQGAFLPRAIYDGPATELVSQFVLVHVEKISLKEMLNAQEEGIKDILKNEENLHINQIGLDDLKKQELAFFNAYQSIKAKQLEAQIKENEIVNNLLTLKSPTSADLFQISLLTKFVGFILFGALAGLGIAYIKQGIEDKWSSIDELKTITGQDVLGVIPWLKDEFAQNAGKIYDAAYSNITLELITKAYQEDASVLSFISTNLYQNKSIVIDNISQFLATLEKTSIMIDFSREFECETDIIDIANFVNDKLKEPKYKDLKTATGGNLLELRLNSDKKANYLLLNEFYEQYKDEIRKMLIKAFTRQDVTTHKKVISLYHLGISSNRDELGLKYLVSTKGFSVLLKLLKREFDFVFINTPHGNIMLPEINFIKKNSESIVLIASIDSNREGLINMVKNITESGQKILGIISREKDTELEKFYNKELNSEYIEGEV